MRNALADIFDDARPLANTAGSKGALAVNAGRTDFKIGYGRSFHVSRVMILGVSVTKNEQDVEERFQDKTR